jgi:hypothetical protein
MTPESLSTQAKGWEWRSRRCLSPAWWASAPLEEVGRPERRAAWMFRQKGEARQNPEFKVGKKTGKTGLVGSLAMQRKRGSDESLKRREPHA